MAGGLQLSDIQEIALFCAPRGAVPLSHAVNLPSMSVLSAHQCLRFASGQVFVQNTSHECHMPHPSHPPQFDDPTSNWGAAQAMKLLTAQYSPFSW